MATRESVFIGIRGNVLAIDAATGAEIWRTTLSSSEFVNVAVVQGRVFASARGELHALDPATGRILWTNPLKGLGLGLVTIAGSSGVPGVEQQRRQQAAAAVSG